MKNINEVWKTKDEFNAWDWMEYRTGRLMISKTIKGITYYKIK